MTKEDYRKRRATWFFWLVVTFGFFLFLYLIKSILLPFVVGILVAYLLDPPTDRLEKIMPRGIATGLIIGGFFAIVCFLLVLLVPLAAKQMAGLADALPQYSAIVKQYYNTHLAPLVGQLQAKPVEEVTATTSDVSGMALSVGRDFVGGLFTSGMAFINLLSLLLITPIVAFYLLRDWDHFTQHVDSLLPRQHAETIRQQMAIIDRTLAGFLRGQILVCMILGMYYAIGLTLVGLKFGMVIGIVTGFLVIFPYVGLMLGMGAGLAAAFFQFGDAAAMGAVLAVFISGQIIEGYFITPKLVGERVGLHPVWIIFGMLAGAALFGFVGILLAIPITAIIGVLIRFTIGRYKLSGYYRGEAKPIVNTIVPQ